MNHLPFETWLLSEEPLSNINTQLLNEHLECCEYCRQLQETLNNVDKLFLTTELVSPAPGFMYRWQDRFVAEQHAELVIRHRWQSLIMLIAIANGVALLLILLGYQLTAIFSAPEQLFIIYIHRLTSIIAFINAIQDISISLFRTFFVVIPLGWWAGFTAVLSIASLLWIYSIRRFRFLPRRTKL